MAAEDGEQTHDGDIPKEGDVLAGKYRIDRVLGQGGMGVVVAAHHTTLRQKVAVKFLLPSAAKRGDATERFLREARAAVSIQSEHVARVSDVGTLDTGEPYMVMEFLTGSDLAQVIEERGHLPVEEAVDYVLQACEAIAEAHSHGIIHRDLKPANLFLTTRADGSSLVKVLDFGLSKATKPDAMDASLTALHVVMGSPYYMAPEQIRSFKLIDARADIWSLGVILYQLLTGATPFEAESLGALFMAIGSDPVPSMRALRPEIPEELEAAVNKCLVKDAKLRTQTVAELARSLAPFGDENSHISVERISRVLSDPTPFSRVPARRAPAPPAVAATTAATAPPPLSAVGVKSGSMSALAVGDSGAPLPVHSTAPPAPAPAKGRGGVILGVAGVAAVAVGVLAFRGMGGGSTPSAPTQGATLTVAATAVAPLPTASPDPALQATAASTVPSVSVGAPASAAASTTASAAAPQAVKPGPMPKGSAGPKLSKPVSAALKHEEKF